MKEWIRIFLLALCLFIAGGWEYGTAEENIRYTEELTRPTGTNWGFPTGENLQAGAATPEEAVQQWINSPSHRENILSTEYEELGVGYIYVPESKYKHYWVQLFRR